ncbi:unnamed protein product, partial [Phaeothamnion confervicola]
MDPDRGPPALIEIEGLPSLDECIECAGCAALRRDGADSSKPARGKTATPQREMLSRLPRPRRRQLVAMALGLACLASGTAAVGRGAPQEWWREQAGEDEEGGWFAGVIRHWRRDLSSSGTSGGGNITDAIVTTDSRVAGASNVRATVAFTLVEALDAAGGIRFQFPGGYDVPAGNWSATAATLVGSLDGALAVSAAGQAVTVARSGGSRVAAGTWLRLRLPAVLTNPSVSGDTGSFPVLEQLDENGDVVDEAPSWALPASLTITPGSFSGAAPAVSLSDYIAGAAGITVLLNFTLGNNALAADGEFEVGFPAGFGVPQGVLNVSSGTISDGTVEGVGSGQNVTVSRIGASAPLAAKTYVELEIGAGFKNPAVSGATGSWPFLLTRDSAGGNTVEEASSEHNSAMVPAGVTLVAAAFVAAPTVTPDDMSAGAADVAMRVNFTTNNPWPADGSLELTFPSGFGVPEASQVPTGIAGADGSMDASGSGQTVTVTRTGDGSDLANGTAVSFLLDGFSNPIVSGDTGYFSGFQTLSSSGDPIDAAADGELTGWDIEPGSFGGSDAPFVTLDSYVAGATLVSATVNFTLGNNALPNDAAIFLSFPAAFTVPSGVMADITDGSAELDGSFAVFGDGQNVTVQRQGDGAAVAAGTALYLTIYGIINPTSSGATDAFPLLRTVDAATSAAIDEAFPGPAGLTIIPASFDSPNPSVGLSTYVAGRTGVTATLRFRPAVALPADGRILLGFPDAFDLAAATFESASSSGIDGSFSVAVSGQNLTLTRSGGGAAVAAGAAVVLSIAEVGNPGYGGSTGDFSRLETLDGSDGSLCLATAAYNALALPSAVTITAAVFAVAPTVTPDGLSAGAVGVAMRVNFTTNNPWPADGSLEITFPAGFSLPATSQALTDVDGADGSFNTSASGQTLTILRSGGGNAAANGTMISFLLAGFTNPIVAGATGDFAGFETLTSGGSSIDAAADGFPAGWDIEPGSFGGSDAPFVTLDSYVAGATLVSATVNFTLGN